MDFLGLAGGSRVLGRSGVAFATLLAWALAAGSASAQVPCGDSVCPKGLSCQSERGGCPAIDCSDGNCPPCDATIEVCVPGPCASDADCGADLRCAEQRSGECSGGAPACTGPDCAPAMETCTETVEHVCVPKWALPCSADADCGEGFRCVERRGSCSDSSPPSGAAGSPTPMSGSGAERSPDCEQTTGELRCEAIRVACTAATGAADPACPTGWTCRDNPEGVCWSDANGNTGCEPGDPPKLCFPPYADLGGASGGLAGDSEGSAVRGQVPVDDGGCTFSPSSKTSAWWAPAALLGLAAFARRRRSSRVA